MATVADLTSIDKAYYGLILSGAKAGLTTSQLWTSLRQTGIYRPGEFGLPSFQAVNTMRGLAGFQARADDELRAAYALIQRTGLDQGITSTMVGTGLETRSVQERNILPAWDIRYRYPSIDSEGNFTTAFKTVGKSRTLPTLGVIRVQVAAEATKYAAVRDFPVLGDVEVVSITAV